MKIIVFLVVTLEFFINSIAHNITDVPIITVQDAFQTFGFSPKCIARVLDECSDETLLEKIASEQRQQTALMHQVLEAHPNCCSSDSPHTSTPAFTTQTSTTTKSLPLIMFPDSCAQIQKNGYSKSGIYTIYQNGESLNPVSAFCELERHGGGWTLIQQRMDIPERENFTRSWSDYVSGFGDLESEHWIGLETIHALTRKHAMTLRIELLNWEGESKYAEYEHFVVEGSDSLYKLDVSGFKGNVGSDFEAHSKQAFSTYDKDNDVYNSNCAQLYKGGWWYSKCHSVNINGLPLKGKHDTYAVGITWKSWTGYYYSLKETRMMVRPNNFTG